MTDTVLAQIAALKAKPIQALKQQWRDLFESEPPPYNLRFLEHRVHPQQLQTGERQVGARLVEHHVHREAWIARDAAQQQVVAAERDRRLGNGVAKAEAAARRHRRRQERVALRRQLGSARVGAGVRDRKSVV